MTKSLIFVLIFSASAFAQTEKPQVSAASKIAVINTEAFADEATGIREVFENYEKLKVEFKPEIDEMFIQQKKIQKLEIEIEEFRSLLGEKRVPLGSYKILDEKIDEYEKLISEYKQKEKEAKELYVKRKAEIFVDVNKKIGEAFKKFAKEKGFALILDSSKLQDSFVISDNPSLDITEEFIKYYKENFVKRKD